MTGYGYRENCRVLPCLLLTLGLVCWAAVTLLRDVGGTAGVARAPSGGQSLSTGFVFTVDNLLKMLSIALRLQVRTGGCASSP